MAIDPEIPDTPSELLRLRSPRSEYAIKITELRQQLQPSLADDMSLIAELISDIHEAHVNTVQDMINDVDVPRDQLVTWTEDTDRLRLVRDLLRSIEPPMEAEQP